MSRALILVAGLAAGCGTVLEPDDATADSELGVAEPAEVIALGAALAQGAFGADPTAINVGGKVHVYSTSHDGLNVPHLTADLVGAATEALPEAQRGRELTGGIWAPTVRRAEDHYAMWYSGELAGDATKKCLWRATATAPEGPFKRVGDGAAICPDPHWSIDPYLYRAPDRFWLYSKVGGQLQRRALEDDGVTFALGSSWQLVLAPTQSWEQGDGQDRPLVENPAIIRLEQPNGVARWIFFYSSNAWRTKGYAVGYADCGKGDSPGACTKETLSKPWLSSGVMGAPFGPGAASFFSLKGRDYMITHGWENRCDDPKDRCASSGDPCPAGTKDNDCRFENPGGRRLYLFRVLLNANGNPVARRI